MATISSAGIGSGLEVSTIVDKLVAIERTPIDTLQTKATAIQSKLSSFGLLSSYMTNLGDIAAKLAQPDFWTRTTAASSDAAAVAATATTASAAAGSYSVAVSQLAQAQGLASQSYAAKTAAVGTGTLHIEIGSWNDSATAFTPDATKTAVDVVIGDDDNTLDAIRARINAAVAGVTASIVNDSSGARLVLRSSATGAASAVRITATDADGADTDAAGLSALAYDPPTATGRLTQTQAARDAQATVNGLAVTSATNSLDGVIDGVTLTLAKVTASAVDVTVAVDTEAQRSAVKSFAQAFSDINTYIAGQTKYDATTKKAAALQGDRATLTLQGTLRDLLQSRSSASSAYARLSDIGIEAQTDGSFIVNDTRLSAALAKPAELAKLFAAAASSSTSSSSSASALSPDGFAVRAKALATQLSGSDGLITTTTKSLRDGITRNSAEQTKLEARVALTKARITKQYSALDTTMSQISATNTQLTQSIAALTSLMTSIANNSG